MASGPFDWLWQGSPNMSGLLPTDPAPPATGLWGTPPPGWGAPAAPAPAPSAPLPPPAVAPPAQGGYSFPIMSSLFGRGQSGAIPGTPPTSGPFGGKMQGALGNISSWLSANPTMVDALAAGISSSPNLRSGLSAAAGAMPQARQADIAIQGQKAAQAYFSNPSVAAQYSPEMLKVIQSDPQMAQAVLQYSVVPRPGVAVAQGGALVNPLNGEVLFNNNPFAPVSGPSTSNNGPTAVGNNAGPSAPSASQSASPSASPSQGNPSQPAPTSTALGGNPSVPKNEGFLQRYSPDTQQLVKDIASYKTPLDSVTTRNGQQAAVAAIVSQYDPSYDSKNYKIIQDTKESFANGPNSVAVQAANTLTGHLYLLSQYAAGLKNGQFRDANQFDNWVKSHSGDPSITNTNTLINGIQREAAKLYAGSGATEGEAQAWGEALNPNMSPDQINGAIDTAVHMMSSRLGSMAYQYKTFTGEDAPIFSPQTVTIMKNMGIDPNEVLNGTLPVVNGTSTAAGATPAQPTEGQIAYPPPGTSGPIFVYQNGKWVSQ